MTVFDVALPGQNTPAPQLAHVAGVCAPTAPENLPDGHATVLLKAQYHPACERKGKKGWGREGEKGRRRDGRVSGLCFTRARPAPLPLTGHVVTRLLVAPARQKVPAAQGRQLPREVMPGVLE